MVPNKNQQPVTKSFEADLDKWTDLQHSVLQEWKQQKAEKQRRDSRYEEYDDDVSFFHED